MHTYELYSSNLELLEVRQQLVSDQHPFARFGTNHHELYSPPDFLSRSFCQAFCLDFKPDPNPKFVTLTKAVIANVPGLCYVASLNTNIPQTIDVVKKLGLFPHTDSAKNFKLHGKITDYGSHLHMERHHAPLAGVGYVGWKFSLYSFLRSTILGTVCYFTGAFVASQPEFRAAVDAHVNPPTVTSNFTPVPLQTHAMEDLVRLASIEAIPTVVAPSLATAVDSVAPVTDTVADVVSAVSSAHVVPPISTISSISPDYLDVNSAAVSVVAAAEIDPTPSTDLLSHASSAISSLYRPVARFVNGLTRDHLPSANSTTFESVQTGLSSFSDSVRSSCDGLYRRAVNSVIGAYHNVDDYLRTSPFFTVKYLFYLFKSAVFSFVRVTFNNPVSTLLVAYVSTPFIRAYTKKHGWPHFPVVNVMTVLSVPAVVGLVCKVFDTFYSSLRFTTITFCEAAGIPPPSALAVTTTGLTATVGTYVLRYTPTGLAIGGRIRRWFMRRPTYSCVLLPPSHGLTTISSHHPTLFLDLSTIVTEKELDEQPEETRTAFVQNKLYAYLGQSSRVVVLNPFFHSFGMKVLGSYCLEPSAVSSTVPDRLTFCRSLTERFAKIAVTFPDYASLHARLMTHT